MLFPYNSLDGNFLMREADLIRKLELTRIKRQIEVFATFLPDELLNQPPSAHLQPRHFVGVFLFADVSGFTPLTEKYNKTGRGGIYRLTATLNAYIGAIVEVIYFFGGDVLKFSGDAFLAMWKADPKICLYQVIHEVIVCGLFIQRNLGVFETEVNVMLKVKIAVSCGNLTMAVVGDEGCRNFVVVGQAVEDVKEAERVSVSGDVVVAPNAWGHVDGESYDGVFTADGHVKILRCLYKPNEKKIKEEYEKKEKAVLGLCEKHIKYRNKLHTKKSDSKATEDFLSTLPERTSIKNCTKTWITQDIKPFIIKPVQEQIEEMQPLDYLTEMREVTIQFINIIPNNYKEKTLIPLIDTSYQIISNITNKHLGVVNKVSLFDKDAMTLVLFGLRGIQHELESQNALKSAYAIKQQVSRLSGVKSVSVGVTKGLVYCGVVGHPLRREYTVIGGCVNKAARIMCAYENKVTCDHKTYLNSKLPSYYFQLQSGLKLKGIENAGDIFEYNESFEDFVKFPVIVRPILDRDIYVNVVETIVSRPNEAEGYRGVCFYGKAKLGKTKLLRTCYHFCKRKGQLVAHVDLCGSTQRPYFAVSKIYNQFFDAKKTVKNLPREVYSIEELYAKGDGFHKKKFMLTKFKEVLKTEASKATVVFIDNMQFVDVQSFDILMHVVEEDKIRLIVAGKFEEDTWHIQWRMSMSRIIKMLELEALSEFYIPALICQMLNVRGVPKNMANLVVNVCEGRPGWIESCLLRFINNGAVEIKYVERGDANNNKYIFPPLSLLTTPEDPTNSDHFTSLPVAELTSNFTRLQDDITLAAVSLDLFDSFTPYQQLLIKTGSVLGEIFTRMLMVIILKYPNETTFATAIKNLFEHDVFDCGTKYITLGGLTVEELECFCFLNSTETAVINERLPKYAFCKLIHFKNKNLKSVAYELLPANQRKELHSQITDILETQTHKCPNCLRDNSVALVNMCTFKEMMKHCNDPDVQYGYGCTVRYIPECDEEFFKDAVRNFLRYGGTREEEYRSESVGELLAKRQRWDRSLCYCIEMLVRVYGDQIYHSERSGNVGKRIFYSMQYGVSLILMSEYREAISYLSQASELCMSFVGEVSDVFKKIHVGRIHMYLAECYYNLNEIEAAKNHMSIVLRQYNIPMMSLRYNLPNKLLGRFFTSKKIMSTSYKSSILKNDLATCFNLLCNIFSAQGNWKQAKVAVFRSISLLRSMNPKISIFCDIYSSALELYNYCGDRHTCEKLEKCVARDLMRNFVNNTVMDLVALGRLLVVLFCTKLMDGELKSSLRMGYRALEVNYNIQNCYLLKDSLLPVLSSALLMSQRIEDAVTVIRISETIGINKETSALVGYYAFCVELILETSFYLQPIENCENFAESYFETSKDTLNDLEQKLIICLYCYHLRKSQFTKALRWKNLIATIPEESHHNYIQISNYLKHMECQLIIHNNNIITHKQLDQEEKRIEKNLSTSWSFAKRWRIFRPRVRTYRAYYSMLKGRRKVCGRMLDEGVKEARKFGNVLESCWIQLNRNSWKGGFSFGTDMRWIDWRQAHGYSEGQWAQIMFALPLGE